MNQILNFNDKNNNDYEIKNVDIKNNKIKVKNNFYFYQFIFSFILALCFLLFVFIRIFQNKQKENISSQLLNSYKIATLYAENNNYTVEKADFFASSKPFVIGMIKIDKINLSYPILSESSKDLLNISVCRFAGPMPNKIGNLCIAGHNYVDYKLFSNLYKLNKKDKIKIYDFNGNLKEYTVFDKYETKPSDLSCTNQETNGQTIVTLVTCNNVTGKRLVIVCK